MADMIGVGMSIAQQAHALGANTFVYFSGRQLFPWELANKELIEQKCNELGIQFVNITIADSAESYHLSEIYEQLIFDNVTRMVGRYGKDTAFFGIADFGLSFRMQNHLINAVISEKAILPNSGLPASYFGALWHIFDIPIWSDWYVLRASDEVIADIRAALSEKNMLGRISTHSAVPDAHLYIYVVS